MKSETHIIRDYLKYKFWTVCNEKFTEIIIGRMDVKTNFRYLYLTINNRFSITI